MDSTDTCEHHLLESVTISALRCAFCSAPICVVHIIRRE
jgi:hypothetical protein